jgi:flagellar FliL protein
MADKPPSPAEEPTDAPDAMSGEGKSSILAKIKVLLIVAVVVVVECLIAHLYLPDAGRVDAMTAAPLESDLEAALSIDEDGATEENDESQVEIDLGEYTVTAYQPVSSTTMRISFHLYGVLAEEDADEFLARKEENEHRLRERVNTIVRSSDIRDLTDPGLGLIKRKILEKINRTLGKALLRGVIFSDFSFIEQ